MRRRLPWVLALPVMAAGSLAAHSLSYLFVAARPAEATVEMTERASTSDASYLVLVLGVLAAMGVIALAARIVLGRGRRRGAAVSPWWFFVLPPLAFALQELAERLLHAESFPFHAALEPRFLLGLALQIPFGLLALLLARALLRVVERLVRALARPLPRLRPAPVAWPLRSICDLPRIPAIALGYPQRGPPTL
jgi:hypothetical protein